jgi:hypothetical protein
MILGVFDTVTGGRLSKTSQMLPFGATAAEGWRLPTSGYWVGTVVSGLHVRGDALAWPVNGRLVTINERTRSTARWFALLREILDTPDPALGLRSIGVFAIFI